MIPVHKITMLTVFGGCRLYSHTTTSHEPRRRCGFEQADNDGIDICILMAKKRKNLLLSKSAKVAQQFAQRVYCV
jgi:hypothetical protein